MQSLRTLSILNKWSLAAAVPLLWAAQSPAWAEPEGLPLGEDGLEKPFSGWSFYFDNDLLIPGASRDQDYTAGVGVTFSGRKAAEGWWSLDPLLGAADSLLPLETDDFYRLHAMQFGVLMFSPTDIASSEAIYDDRPFANLAYLSNSRLYVRDADEPVYQTAFTLGVMGSQLGATLQDRVHRVVGSDLPNGWDHQVSDGGELTFQYTAGRQALLASNFQSERTEYEIKYTSSASIGYISETSLSLTGRWGLINTPWWSFTPENGDYSSRPAPVIGESVRRGVGELYLWGGVKVRARAYNAFLQGQFRESDVTFSSGELNHLLGEAWLGVTAQLQRYRLSYVLRYQNREIKSGAGARSPLWAGIIISYDL
ncbi:lipid A deacylase LpxR family protein [Microbulbifer rhizosphaerae]|uniref:Lipid A deacylase LpxR family protein n=1 Tax=Microbulbifer rhizosphaerae TaxID=1562603 RepID=A0A7W4W9C6_9GAMM|nr:lipid A deacylase LpxR family protein [Microbulbifer rhizosphaerae]MBB3060090.1 hypothetical protein [Microbulbifer rhizosphaerae]